MIKWIDGIPLVRIERLTDGAFAVGFYKGVCGIAEGKTMLQAMHKAYQEYQYWLSIDQELGE